MKKGRQTIAITLVATALFADRGLWAAPIPAPQVARMASRLVGRLGGGVGRIAERVRLYANRQEKTEVATVIVEPAPLGDKAPSRLEVPFQFRLPPPVG